MCAYGKGSIGLRKSATEYACGKLAVKLGPPAGSRTRIISASFCKREKDRHHEDNTRVH